MISLGFCIACVASDSFFFFLSSQLSRRSRAETLAMQASFCIKALIVLARPTLSLLALRKSQLWTSWNRCWFTRTNGLNRAFAARLCCINYYIFSATVMTSSFRPIFGTYGAARGEGKSLCCLWLLGVKFVERLGIRDNRTPRPLNRAL